MTMVLLSKGLERTMTGNAPPPSPPTPDNSCTDTNIKLFQSLKVIEEKNLGRYCYNSCTKHETC